MMADASATRPRLPTFTDAEMPVAHDLTDYAALLDALNCGAILVDRGGHVVHANAAFTDLLGEPADSFDGRTLLEIGCESGDCGALVPLLQNFDDPHEIERALPRRDGTRVTVIVSGRPLAGPVPLPSHRLVTVVDITAQKNAENRYAEQYRNLVRLSDTVLEQALELKSLNTTLEERVRQRTAELREANLESIYMLAVAGEAKDSDTGAHIRRIEHYSAALARMAGQNAEEAERIGYSSILHDVGKLLVPDEVLKKPGPLTEEERRTMELHTIVGEKILSPKPFFTLARQIARSHHENWDGSGYPDGLTGEAIPYPARIVRLVDVFDALTSSRVYKDAWTPGDALRAIRADAGKLFDPDLTAAFVGLYESGALRRIADEVAAQAGE